MSQEGNRPRPLAAVFGGSGFLGRRVVARLLEDGWRVRIVCRNVSDDRSLFEHDEALTFFRADIEDETARQGAVKGADAVINAVSLYLERGEQTYDTVHVEAAGQLAAAAEREGVSRFLHLSGIGADASSHLPYIRSRGQGERAVRDRFPDAILIRPAVMFGRDDTFVTPVSRLLRRLPVFALFGRGEMKLRPVYVGDVASAIAKALHNSPGLTYELAGPDMMTYREFVETLRDELRLHTLLTPMPLFLWRMLAAAAERLPHSPLGRTQVDLMQAETLPTADAPGFDRLDITPQSLWPMLPHILHDQKADPAVASARDAGGQPQKSKN